MFSQCWALCLASPKKEMGGGGFSLPKYIWEMYFLNTLMYFLNALYSFRKSTLHINIVKALEIPAAKKTCTLEYFSRNSFFTEHLLILAAFRTCTIGNVILDVGKISYFAH